jgi:hypothetical protein
MKAVFQAISWIKIEVCVAEGVRNSCVSYAYLRQSIGDAVSLETPKAISLWLERVHNACLSNSWSSQKCQPAQACSNINNYPSLNYQRFEKGTRSSLKIAIAEGSSHRIHLAQFQIQAFELYFSTATINSLSLHRQPGGDQGASCYPSCDVMVS